ncbi:FeoA family protein [Bacillus swezeyi]|uniref:Ferrous iron transport protein A n=1 Tax=Bacillus swezeyi TaxID=1925020 RepID=A0A1R1QQY8_9BACI|nr:FeoA family protein [Bacillus swezeyi]KAA6447257.1 ferrous iron transport protein A [Bacillus swezeyi]KAA6472947.1 ferrous iron transport protein A [Bacillus swezeyi]MEC1258949.1 FeoA family protein [Bacillus swezeyi]MED1738074.1 FeoA family protein [Bacillus swezeyi]MED2928090.1 FeoA family protein [Bacillus swezeyi]
MVLADLRQKEKAKIIDFSEVNELVQRRLIHLGMKEDAEICVKRKLPFGGPCMFETGGQCVSIRLHDAKQIRIEKL